MKDKLKVLMTTDTVGGVWVYSLELCKALESQGVEIYLAALGAWPSPAQEKAVESLKNVRFYRSDYKLEWMEEPWFDVEQSRKWLNSIYHTVEPDIVHLNNYAHIEESWSTPVITVFHSCVQTWWQAVKGHRAPHGWDQYTRTVEESLEASDVVVSPTRAILTKARQTHGFTTEAKVIYNGRQIGQKRAKKEDIILCMGRIWDEAKNLSLLSRIAQKLPWPVYVAGESINPDTGVECNLEHVNFLGKLSPEQVQEWMSRASIYVSPTRYEPFGLAILEAAANGCALVLSDLDTLKEIWDEAALFFGPEDEVEAEKHLIRLIQDPSLLQSYSRRALERAAYFTAEKMGEAYYNLYSEVLNKTPKTLSL